MKDGQISQTGNSRLIKGQLPPTYEEFVAKVAEGSQGLDLLFNVEGWTQLPTFLNKAALLQDATEQALFGDVANRTVDEAFLGIAQLLQLIKSNMATINLTVRDAAGRAVQGVLVQGIVDSTGKAVYTNSSGVASGLIAEGNSTIKISGYCDINDHSETIAVTKGTTITKSWTVTTVNFLKVTSSKSLKFSGNVETIDYCLLSGGGGGGGGLAVADSTAATGGGGGAGDVYEETGFAPIANESYQLVVGAGGAGGTLKEVSGSYSYTGSADSGSNGGTTSAFGHSVAGGKGGSGGSTGSPAAGGASNNGAGAPGVRYDAYSSGKGSNGSAGTKSIYDSFTTTVAVGGGGGSGSGGWNYNSGRTSGGAPAGGAGGYCDSSRTYEGNNGTAQKGGGGGGGGSASWYSNSDDEFGSGASSGGKGGSGCITIRMYLKSAA